MQQHQTTMALVYGNMANLCLLCAKTQNSKERAFIEIYGQLGTQMKILEKINKFLSVAIEPGFPLQVCANCVGKLNVCDELGQLTEKAYGKFKSLKKQWEAILQSEEPCYDMDDDWSHVDVYVPSPEADCHDTEIQELETDDFQPIEESQMGSTDEIAENKEPEEYLILRQPIYLVKGSRIAIALDDEEHPEILTKKSGVKSMEETGEENQSKEFPMLQQPFYVVKGSQIAIFVAKEDTEILYQYSRLGLALINLDANCSNNKEKIAEKISRVMRHVKNRFATTEEQSEEKETSTSSPSAELLHSCHSCRCSFFLQEEMLSHFESLHPEEVHQCSVCDEKICGPVQMQEKHMELHRSLEEGQTDELLSTLRVPSVNTIMYDPEFVVVVLGEYPHYLCPTTDKMLQAEFTSAIQRNVWIKPDMKNRLSRILKTFVSKVKLYVRKVVKPKLKKQKPPRHKCDVCGQNMSTKKRLESHIAYRHNHNRIKCHCKRTYLPQNEISHIESCHNSGITLACRTCDSMFIESGEVQPHMTPASVFPFKCPSKNCKRAYISEDNLESHRQKTHTLKPGTPGATQQYLCELCGKVYRHKHTLKLHVKAVHFPSDSSDEIAMLTCEFCGLPFKNTDILTVHRKRHHDPKVPCTLCGKMFNTITLKKHMKFHTEEPQFACKYCNKLFRLKSNCTLHEQRIHEGIKLHCSICKDMSFKSIKGFEQHKLKHERGEEIVLPRYMQPVKCSICSKVLENAVRLYNHTQWHKKTGNDGKPPERKKYTRNGEKRGTTEKKTTLQRRERNLTFPCRVCLLRFMTKDCYNRHVETHHPNGVPKVILGIEDLKYRYQCRYCDKNFKKKDFCNDHETTHGSGKQYACVFCGKKYSYYSDKWTHQHKKCPSRPQTSGSN